MNEHKKILLALLFVLAFQYSIGQDTCVFKLHTGFNGEIIRLLDSHKFEYTSYGCAYNNEETGIFHFDNRELKLIFLDSSNSQLESRMVELESIQTSVDKVKIQFKIKSDIDNRPLEFASIMILEDEKVVIGSKTNSVGEATLTFKNNNSDFKIRVSFVGHQTFEMPYEFNNAEYIIKINLSKKRTKLHKNKEEVIYQIASEGEDFIEMSKNGKDYMKYKFTCH